MRSSALLLALAIPPLVATTAPAGPIRMTYEPMWGDSKPVSILLPDDFATNGFKFTLEWTRAELPGWTFLYPWQLPPGTPPPAMEGVMGRSYWATLTLDREPLGAALTTPEIPMISFRVDVSGQVRANRYGSVHLHGQWDGTATGTLWIRNSSTQRMVGPEDYERWERDLGISRAFLEHLTAPDALEFSGIITDGALNRLPIELSVSPMPIPAPVPEPASWAAWGLAIAGAWAWRRRRGAALDDAT